MGARLGRLLFLAVLAAGCDGEILGGGSAWMTVKTSGPGGGSSLPSLPGTPGSGGPLDGAALYTANCSGCHGPLATSAKRGATVDRIQHALATVIPMAMLQSKLTLDQITAISAALQDPAMPAMPTDSPAQVGLTLGNADFMQSTFTALFVSDANTADDQAIASTIGALIGGQVASIGGACRRYDDYCPVKGEVDIDEYDTGIWNDDPDQSGTAFDPASNAMRKGYLVRACREVLDNDTAVTNALSTAGLTTSSGCDDAAVSALCGQFFPGTAVDGDVKAALEAGFSGARSSGSSALDAWRFTLLTLCTADAVEIL
jgi:hypothetical protein